MSLLEELGLQPGDAGRMALKSELESRRSQWGKPGYHYRGAGDFLLQHGEWWNGRELPEEFEPLTGETRECFANAWQAADQVPHLAYVEGVYATGDGHFTPHGWCVDTRDGGIVELTYPTKNFGNMRNRRGNPILPPAHWSYVGVRFRLELIEWHCNTHGLPMLDRPAADHADAGRVKAELGIDLNLQEEHDWPILKVPYEPNRVDLEGV